MSAVAQVGWLVRGLRRSRRTTPGVNRSATSAHPNFVANRLGTRYNALVVDPGRTRSATEAELTGSLKAIEAEHRDADVLRVDRPHTYVLERGARRIVHVMRDDPARVDPGITYTTWVVEWRAGCAKVSYFRTKVSSSGEHFTLPPPPA